MDKFFTSEQIAGIVRTVGASTATYAIAKGWLTPAGAEWVVSGLVAVAAGAWSWWAKRPHPDA